MPPTVNGGVLGRGSGWGHGNIDIYADLLIVSALSMTDVPKKNKKGKRTA